MGRPVRVQVPLPTPKRIQSDVSRDRDVVFVFVGGEQSGHLYPYAVFFSPEVLEVQKKCTICVVSIRHPCGHEPGEIYDGRLCLREVTSAAFIGVAMVTKPAQKYFVAFLKSESGEKRDHYKYDLVEFVMKRLEGPFEEW